HVFKCSPRVFLMFQFYTTVIGLFPTIGLTMYSHKTLKAKYSSEAENISKDHSNNVRVKNSPVKEIQLISNSASESDLLIPLHSLYAIASDGNYIRVFLEGKKDIQNKILRKTLKETEDELSGHREILRVHRGYLVNISKIKCVTGNAQGLILHFENPELTIPVSRKFIDSLRNNYNHL
ncbi:MAG TPA: LytTR family DNA-binding domain-containing protein, partial [Bacteroidales bacterium]|nr:LytTR family DNA-binding domain-containing protein [Bacteroidales bacterium]